MEMKQTVTTIKGFANEIHLEYLKIRRVNRDYIQN